MTYLPQAEIPSLDLIFETSWEVCNKIGGIYTVLSTKAKALQYLYKDKVVFIGPDVWDETHPSPYFKEYKTLMHNAAKSINGSLPHNISIRIGRWNIPGQPMAVLVKFSGVYEHLDSYYGKSWEKYGVDSLHAYGDYPEGCAFAIASSIVIDAITKHLKVDVHKVIAHFDEWTTAMGLLNTELISPEIATMFTTHATSIGRSICGNGKPLYDYFDGYNGDQMAEELNMESKHSLEKNAALNADCFTTVSDVTAKECKQLLDKTPDIVTPNGFEAGFVPSNESTYNRLRKISRNRLISIATALTDRKYDDDTFIVATSGRNEYRNKGIDLYIDAINRIRTHNPEAPHILAFIMVPAWVREPRMELIDRLDNKSARLIDGNKFLTHTLNNEDSDSIACRLRELNVNVCAEDNVTIVFLPCYLDGHDSVLNISYYDMMPGLDATIFPSYYEPWGYTPLESIAFGVPTISTDKAGFGQWILSNYDNSFRGCGAHVVERTDSNYPQACECIAESVLELAQSDDSERKISRKAAITTSKDADWNIFIRYYLKAFEIALKKRDIRMAVYN